MTPAQKVFAAYVLGYRRLVEASCSPYRTSVLSAHHSVLSAHHLLTQLERALDRLLVGCGTSEELEAAAERVRLEQAFDHPVDEVTP